MKKLDLFLMLLVLLSSGTLMAQYTHTDLQNAIDAASPGDVITLNTGTYEISSPVNVNKQNLTIQGNSTILHVSGTAHSLDLSASGITIQNLDIIKTDILDQGGIIWIHTNDISIKNNIVHGQFNIGDAPVSRAMVISGGISGLLIDGNTFYSLRQPAYMSGPTLGIISNNHTYGTKGWVLEGGDVTFVNNTWGINVYDIAIIGIAPITAYTDIVAMSNANNGAVIEDQRIVPAVLSVVSVDASTSYSSDLGGKYHPYSTITPALARVVNGGKILVAAGTYEEQLTIDNKSLTILGAAQNSTFINSPAVLNTTFATSYIYKCVVGVVNNGNLVIKDLTLNGLGRGNANNRFVGIGFRNSSGIVEHCKVLDIRDTPFSGVQHGVAVYAYNDDLITRTISVLNNEIIGFQKNAITLNASDTNPSTVNVAGNIVTGFGATPVTAQNGIQVSGNLITGIVQNNTISGIGYSGAGYVATSILNFYADININSNTVTEGHVGIYNIDGAANISGNNITAKKIGSYGYGIVASDPPQAVPSPFDLPVHTSKLKGIESLVPVTLVNNNVTFSGPDNTFTYGIEADAGYGPDDLSILATNNTVSGFGVGIGVYRCETDCNVGVFTSLNFNNNNILGNTIGFETNLTTPVFAENNWWGTAIESEIQALINGLVDYDPWIGKSNSIICTNPNVNYNFLNGVIIKFTSLPVGGGNVNVMRENHPPTPFPANLTNLGMWIDLTSVMANLSFNAQVIADVSGLPGFDATTTVMYFNSATNSWLAVTGGTYSANDPLFGGHPSFSFVTNHFTPFTYINTPATAFDVYLSASTSASAGFIYPNTDWGVTSYEPNDWDFTTPVTFYIVPEIGSVFGASDITIEWDNTMFGYAGVDPVGGIYDGSQFLFYHNQLGTTDKVTINAGRLDNTNFTITAGQYIAKLNLNLLKTGFGPISITALDFRAFNGIGGQFGVYVTGNNAQVKSYLGDVASTTPASSLTGDGLVNFDDLALWSISYWSGVGSFGMTNYQVKYDVGPTTTNTVYGMPTTDAKIQFEDLVIFSMSYGLSASHVYPKLNEESTAPVELKLGEPVIAGNTTRVPLFVSGGVQNVRAMNLIFAGQFGKLTGVEKGNLLAELTNPVMVMSNTEGNQVFVDLAVFGADELGINSEGEVLTLIFEGNTEINLSIANVRNIFNKPMDVMISASGELVPDEFVLLQNYPNPFNPSTKISYELPTQAMVEVSVFNALGEQVETLVNELKEAGRYTLEFNASGYSSGIYFYQIKANDFMSVKKMLLMK